MLPAFVRELILQDRGNSLYLSDSFANLPSPVNETQNLKQLFKAKDNEEDLKNGNAKRDKLGKDSNIEIRIEGKDHSPSKNKKDIDDSIDKKAQANIDVRDIEKIVFESYNRIGGADKAKGGGQKGVKAQEYVEEESYVNPTNMDCESEMDYEDQKLRSIVNRGGFGHHGKLIDYRSYYESDELDPKI